MNIRKIFIASAVLATALVSCRKEAPVEKLSTDKTVVTAVAEGGRLAVEVYASGGAVRDSEVSSCVDRGICGGYRLGAA